MSHFSHCARHFQEAVAVYAALEELNGGPLPSTDPDVALDEVMPRLARAGGDADSLDALERRMAMEGAIGVSELETVVVAELADESIMKALLGPAWRIPG